MFPQSSQMKFWMFSDENDLTILREKTNAEFIEKHGTNMTVSLFFIYSTIKFFYYHFFHFYAYLCDEILTSKI